LRLIFANPFLLKAFEMSLASRSIAALALPAFLALGACANNVFVPGELNFSHAEMSAQLAKRFPVQRTIAGLIDISLMRPRVSTRKDTSSGAMDLRLAATFDVDVKVLLTSRVVSGTVAISGMPRYDASSRSVFLSDARVDSIRAENMPEALSAALTQAASSMAKDYLQEKPLRTFTDAELTRYGMSLSPKHIEVREGGVALVMR
jgi:Protein of unknown function (DUF1439)